MTLIETAAVGLSLYLGFCFVGVMGQMADAMRAIASAINKLGELEDDDG